MKKLLTLMLLACSTVALAQTEVKRITNQRIKAVPQAFTLDSKAVIYLLSRNYYSDEEQTKATILDENLQEVRSFNLVKSEGKSKCVIEERKDVGTIEIDHQEEYQLYDGDKEIFTEEEAIELIAQYFGEDKSAVIVDRREDGTYLFFQYNYEEVHGVKYARYYGFLDKDNKLFRCYMYYSINHSYTGDWESRTEESTPSDNGAASIYLQDWRSTYADGESFYLSQSLFNNDATFEYMLPLFEQQSGRTEERDRDNDGNVDYKETYYDIYTVGFNIVSESGSIIQSVRFGDGLYTHYLEPDLYLIGNKCFLAFECYDQNAGKDSYEDIILVYAIDRTASTIQQVARHEGPRVSPTIADRTETISVKLEEAGAREVQVVNAAGKTVLRVPVKAGQHEVTFPARHLSRGVNVVNVIGSKDNTTCKVVVK